MTGVTAGSPADAAGLAVGDVIAAVGGQPVAGLGDLVTALGGQRVGASVDVQIERRGRTQTVKVGLGQRPF